MTSIKTTSEKKLMLFSGRAYPELADEVAEYLDIEVTPDLVVRLRQRRDLRAVRGVGARQRRVRPAEPGGADINKWVMEQLIMVDALKRASAKRITVVMPFYPYARQDKKHRGREPISARLIADLFKTAGADRLMAVDLHTSQIQGFFDGPVDHLFALPLLAAVRRAAGSTWRGWRRLAGRRPGAGGRALDPGAGRLPAGVHPQEPRPAGARTRPSPTGSSATCAGRVCVVVDDMIDTGGTIVKAADALYDYGAADVIIAATHAVFSGPAVDRLKNSRVSEVVVTNTLPLTRGEAVRQADGAVDRPADRPRHPRGVRRRLRHQPLRRQRLTRPGSVLLKINAESGGVGGG